MKDAKSLIEKFKAGNCTPEEIKLINKWLLEIHAGELSDLSSSDFEQIGNETWVTIEQFTREPKRFTLWSRIAVAAASIAAITFGVWFYNEWRNDSDTSAVIVVNTKPNDIAPGHNGATLTLANGEVIELSDAKSGVVIGDEKLSYNDGTAISSTLSVRKGHLSQEERIEMLTTSTAKGQTYQVTLPDGTRVWLNADSKISFPSQFIGKERKILLEGEGYFEVAKNKIKPFIVQTDKQTVEVLGTHFNINSYSDEATVRTTLLEGSVQVSPLSPQEGPLPEGERSIILKPGQQSIISGSAGLKVIEADIEEAMAWKDGLFKFNNEKLETIMRKISRWYNVDVVYQQDNLKQTEYGGTVSRFENISSVLSKLEYTGQVHFKIEGKKIIITK